MNLTLALTLFSSAYSISLEYNSTLTYVFIQSLNSTGFFSSVIKKQKNSKANCMDLTFVLHQTNMWPLSTSRVILALKGLI